MKVENELRILLSGQYIFPEERKFGGPNRVLSELVDNLTLFPSVRVSLISSTKNPVKINRVLLSDNVEILFANESNIFRVLKEVKKKTFDVINAWGPLKINVISLLLKNYFNVPFIYSAHGILLDELKLYYWQWTNLFHVPIDYLLIKKSDVIIVPSNIFKDRLTNLYGIDKRKVFVIPNGFKTPHVSNSTKIKKENMLEKILSIEEPILLFVGITSPIKGIDLLLRSFIKLNVEASLVIVGSSTPFFRKIMDRLKKIDIIREKVNRIYFFESLDPELLNILYMRTTCLIIPSYQDSFPLVVTEAMSSGKPVIISNKVGIIDIIVDEVNGFVFTAGNDNELANKIEKIIDNVKMREKVGYEAKKTALKRTWEKVAYEYIKFYTLFKK